MFPRPDGTTEGIRAGQGYRASRRYRRNSEGKAMVEGALILLAGIAAGWLLRSLPARRKKPIPAEPPKPVCGCGHHRAMHDPEKGMECAVDFGNKRKCACCHYSGPEPLPAFYAPEIAGEAGQ